MNNYEQMAVDDRTGMYNTPLGKATAPREIRLHETLAKSYASTATRMENLLEALARRVEPVSRQEQAANGGAVPGVNEAISSTSPLAEVINDYHRRVHHQLNILESILNRIEL